VAFGWLPEMGYASIHYRHARCPKSRSIQRCMNKKLGQYLPGVNDAKKRVLESATPENYERLLNAQAKSLARVLSCGDCGPLVLSDSFLVLIISELYFALGPETKVIFTRRDAQDWAASRLKNHGYGFICSEDTPDPFSFSQCAHRRARATTLGNAGVTRLHQHAFVKYNAYIHALVLGNNLLDINLFSSQKIVNGTRLHLDDETARKVWSGEYRKVVETFLG